MLASRNKIALIGSLLFAVFLWGGNNTGIRVLVQAWPPILVGGTRFTAAGFLMAGLLRWTNWLGQSRTPPARLRRQFWFGGGLSLAVYIAIFNWALHFTTASHVALYLGAAPVWALVWEGVAGQRRTELIKRFGAAALALFGVVVLLWPALRARGGSLPGELLGVAASVTWVWYGRECRALGAELSGAEVGAHTMWRAGLWLIPFGLLETGGHPVVWDAKLGLVQLYCIVAGSAVAFALWNNALRQWKTSEVYLFNNLIPLSTMLWAHFCINEPMTPTFWTAMGFIACGVLLGQASWGKKAGAEKDLEERAIKPATPCPDNEACNSGL